MELCLEAAGRAGRKRTSETDRWPGDRGIDSDAVLQPELSQNREDSQRIDEIRRGEHIDPIRIIYVALNQEVLLECRIVFHQTIVHVERIFRQNFHFDQRWRSNRLSWAE